MKLAYVNYYFDNDLSLREYFNKYPSIHGWCESVNDSDIDITVYQRFNGDFFFKKKGVQYKLINDGPGENPEAWKNTRLFHGQIIKDKPDIIHINSFNYLYQGYLLKRQLPESKIVFQHHAEKYRCGLKRYPGRFFSNYADGFIFSSKFIYEEWSRTGSISPVKCFAEIIENSTNFSKNATTVNRNNAGLTGEPVLLWVGRLNENKDPVTVLSGFEMLLNDFPKAMLYMVYSEKNLENKIFEMTGSSERLQNSVRLLGKTDHSLLNNYYNSADYFVAGSHYEGSGYSLIESMACGVIPIVTDIPSFRTITKNGKAGVLWQKGNPESFYEKAKEIINKDKNIQRKIVGEIFDSDLSFDSISRKAGNFYREILNN